MGLYTTLAKKEMGVQEKILLLGGFCYSSSSPSAYNMHTQADDVWT